MILVISIREVINILLLCYFDREFQGFIRCSMYIVCVMYIFIDVFL